MNQHDGKKLKLPIAAKALLKHRPPMLLIDQLLDRGNGRATASAEISATSIFCIGKNSVLPEYFIEVIAQTMAAANGYDGLAKQSGPKAGFIVGIDAFSLDAQVSAPAELIITVTTTMEFGTMKVMTGEVLLDSRPVASAEIKVWEQPERE